MAILGTGILLSKEKKDALIGLHRIKRSSKPSTVIKSVMEE